MLLSFNARLPVVVVQVTVAEFESNGSNITMLRIGQTWTFTFASSVVTAAIVDVIPIVD
jgi:hypothetical protein